MTHPLVYLLVRRPHMLVVHAQAYVDLLGTDAVRALSQAKLKALLSIVTLCMAAVSMVLTGIAATLWGVLPAPPMRWPWVMLAVPGTSWMITLFLAWTTSRVHVGQVLAEFKRQVEADIALYKEMRSV